MVIQELYDVQRRAVEDNFIELLNRGFSFVVDPDAHDIMQKLANQSRVPPDWYRRNYENRERWLREQREAGFVE